MTWTDSILGTIVLLGAGAAVGTLLGLIVKAVDYIIGKWRKRHYV